MLPLLLAGVSGCSDSADSSEVTVAPTCTLGDVLLSETPPAPEAVCSIPPGPVLAIFENAVAQQQSAADQRRAELLDPSRIAVVTCGTGSPFPSPRAQSCLAVFVNGQFLLFDAGDRAQDSMENLNLPVTDIAAIFLTHFYSDHIADLGEVISRTWTLGRDQPLVVYEVEGVRVLAYKVDHSPVGTALGFRVEYAGKALAVSGDTIDTPGRYNGNLVIAEDGTEVVIHPLSWIMRIITDG